MSKKWIREAMAGPDTQGAYTGAIGGGRRAKQFKRALIDARDAKLAESGDKSRYVTVCGYTLLQICKRGKWVFSGHGETARCIKQLKREGKL